MKYNDKKTKDFLLEVGAEELPSNYIEQALLQLRSSVEESLKNSRLKFNQANVFATPNRLIIYIKGLTPRQGFEREKIMGPSKDIAFDKEGKPTEACLGFLKSKGAKLKDILVEATPKGKYLFIERPKESKATKTVLALLLPGIIASVRFPKTMRWDESDSRFARPIRWLLSLYDSEVINFKLGSLTSSNLTRLPRYLNPSMRTVKVNSIKDYFNKFEKYKAVLNQDVRRKVIATILKDSTNRLGAGNDFNEDLINTVTYLLESPIGFIGKFRKEYLRLPVEILESSMAKNQRVFLVKDKKGKAFPYFIAIINTSHKNIDGIRSTYEAILDAKLKDSIFFLEEDLKLPLQDRVESLKGLVFQTKLGTVYDRVMRLEKLSLDIANSFDFPGRGTATEKIGRAALLSKADLVTYMVKEYPDLQGIIGREYAKKAGEDKEIANAIYEHYLPKGIAGTLPTTDIGSFLAMADKIDAIVGFFAIGLIPTGSEDPYGIRRASLGLLKILLEKKYPISFNDLIDWTFSRYGNTIACDKSSVKSQIIAFQKERLKNILLDKKFRDDIIDAILESEFDRFDRLYKKLNDLSSIVKSKHFLEAAKVVERTTNILKIEKASKESIGKVKADHLKEPLEKELWEIYEKHKDKIEELITKGDYIEATKIYAEAFYKPLDVFFEKVKVNVEDDGLRRNRLALMKAIHAIYVDKVADLSKIKFN